MKTNHLHSERIAKYDDYYTIKYFQEIPSSFSLSQNYPNPFNSSSKISFDLLFEACVSLNVFDALGKEVKTLLARELSAGSYSEQGEASG
jgi:hypothetical protein